MMTYDKLQEGLEDVRGILLRLSEEFKVPAYQNPFMPDYEAVQFAIAWFKSNENDVRDALGEFEDDGEDPIRPELDAWCDRGNHYVSTVWMDTYYGLVCAEHLTDMAVNPEPQQR